MDHTQTMRHMEALAFSARNAMEQRVVRAFRNGRVVMRFDGKADRPYVSEGRSR